MEHVIEEARAVFHKEIAALERTRDALGPEFAVIADLIHHCRGKVVLSGVGKPGHIGKKIAATLASLGTPAFFVHPAEAMHGDLGMVEARDVVLLLSYSGESEEVTRLLPVLRQIGCVTVAITGQPNSTLARACAYRFIFPAFEEACHLHLAPTSSTTALLVLGDALAVAVSRAKHYTEADFGRYHPAGPLGKEGSTPAGRDCVDAGRSESARNIKLLVMDVDGTLTDGCIHMGGNGEMMKAFNVQDGYGIAQILPRYGVIPVIITGRESKIVENRARELKISHVYQGVGDKLGKLKALAQTLGAAPEQIAYIGDDLNDLECIRWCGVTGCPADAVPEVRAAVDHVCTRMGGKGAVREFIDILIRQ